MHGLAVVLPSGFPTNNNFLDGHENSIRLRYPFVCSEHRLDEPPSRG
jgi:hypothetical protein